MTTTYLRFKDFGELTADLAFRARDLLRQAGIDADFGASNVSCSTYLNLPDGRKIRFSDHGDFVSGADLTLRVDDLIRTIHVVYDADCEPVEMTDEELEEVGSEVRSTANYLAVEIDAADAARLVAAAAAFAVKLPAA